MSQSSIQQEVLNLGLSGKELKRRKGLISSKTAHKSRTNKPAEHRAPKIEAPTAEPVMVAAE